MENNTFHSIIHHDNTTFYCMLRENTIKELIQGKSFIRFGDGEYNLINKIDVHFQKYDPKFKPIFEEILKNPLHLNYITGQFLKENKNSTWNSYNDVIIKIMNNCEKIYYHDALIFRSKRDPLIYIPLFQYFKTKRLCIVNSSLSVLNYIKNLDSNFKFIQCESTNCFDQYDFLYNEIIKLSKEYIILLSCGPCAKVLGYNLIKLGYQIIDLGAGYKHLGSNYETVKDKI